LFSVGNNNDLLVEKMIQTSRDSVIVADEYGVIAIVNQETCRLLGKENDKIVGSNISLFFSELKNCDFHNDGETAGCEIEYNNKKYVVSSAPLVYKGDYQGALITLRHRDIESEQLYRCKELLDNITAGCSDGIYITDSQGTGLYMNNADYQITGLTAAQVIGRTIYQMVDDGLVTGSAVVEVLKTKKPASVLQKTPNGKTVMVTGIPLFDEFGHHNRVVASTRDITELIELKKQLDEERRLNDRYYSELMSIKQGDFRNSITTYSEKMFDVVELATQVAKTDSTVLITGESGVGKEVIAKLIYNASHREKELFLKVNCAAIPEHLLESELFGYEDGAFTGAKKGGKKGLVESVDKGTLFLDEIGELPFVLQGKLLQVLQDRMFIKVGGIQAKAVDVRIIAATNRDLRLLVEQGRFREDLYYRLNVVPIYIPPLRERCEDVLPLAHIFLLRFNQKYSVEKELSIDVQNLLQAYSWSGNVRELENCIERLVILSKAKTILPEHLPLNIISHVNKHNITINGIIPLREAQEEVERILYLRAYDSLKNTYKVAKALEVSQPTVVRKVKKYKAGTNK
jgi:PAS domain S-box-containing protein